MQACLPAPFSRGLTVPTMRLQPTNRALGARSSCRSAWGQFPSSQGPSAPCASLRQPCLCPSSHEPTCSTSSTGSCSSKACVAVLCPMASRRGGGQRRKIAPTKCSAGEASSDPCPSSSAQEPEEPPASAVDQVDQGLGASAIASSESLPLEYLTSSKGGKTGSNSFSLDAAAPAAAAGGTVGSLGLRAVCT